MKKTKEVSKHPASVLLPVILCVLLVLVSGNPACAQTAEFRLSGGWEKVEPCSDLSIERENLKNGIVAGKTTANEPLVIWTAGPVDETAKTMIVDSLRRVPGVGRIKEVKFIQGDGASLYGICVRISEGEVLLDHPSSWSLLYFNRYLLITEPEEPPIVDTPEESPKGDVPGTDTPEEPPVIENPEEASGTDTPEEPPVIEKPEEPPVLDPKGDVPKADTPKEPPAAESPEEPPVDMAPDTPPAAVTPERSPDRNPSDRKPDLQGKEPEAPAPGPGDPEVSEGEISDQPEPELQPIQKPAKKETPGKGSGEKLSARVLDDQPKTGMAGGILWKMLVIGCGIAIMAMVAYIFHSVSKNDEE